MKLRAMNEEEFKRWYPKSLKQYADEKVRANGFTADEAKKIAEDTFSSMLPKGLASQDNFLYIFEGKESSNLGYLWYSLRGNESERKAWICDVLIEEEFRGRGFGKQLMKLLEVDVKSKGVISIGLHVFAHNHAALSLYKSLGYQTTDLCLEKKI